MDVFAPSDLKSILHSKRANVYYLEHCRVLVNGGRVEYVTDELTKPVHPHACGEHEFQARMTRSAGGSSPRMWGTRCHGQGGSGG